MPNDESSRPTGFLLRPTEFFFHWLRRGVATNRIFVATNAIFIVTNAIPVGYENRMPRQGSFDTSDISLSFLKASQLNVFGNLSNTSIFFKTYSHFSKSFSHSYYGS
jgi:hypothetical protein